MARRWPRTRRRPDFDAWIGFGIFIWLLLFFWLGIATLRNGPGWLFFFLDVYPNVPAAEASLERIRISGAGEEPTGLRQVGGLRAWMEVATKVLILASTGSRRSRQSSPIAGIETPGGG